MATKYMGSISNSTHQRSSSHLNAFSITKYRIINGLYSSKLINGGAQLSSPKMKARHAIRHQTSATAAPVTPAPAFAGPIDESAILDTVIVGAGISGLTTALVRFDYFKILHHPDKNTITNSIQHPTMQQALQSEHSNSISSILITESRGRVGGNITTVSNDDQGLLWEEGPNSFQPSDAILKAAVDAGITDELVLGDPTAPRFVYWEGRLRPTPSGPDVLTFDLMSILGKIRAGLGALGIKESMPEKEESVEQFVRRNLGDEVFYRLIEPFCSGVYAGDPTKLSMKAAFGKVYDLEKKGGSIIGGVLKLIQERKANPPAPRDPRLPPKPAGQTVGSFRRGLKTLPEAIANKMSDAIRTSWTLKRISKEISGEESLYRLTYDTPQGQKEIRTRTVALTVPSYVASDLLRDVSSVAADAIGNFDYPPVAAVTLAYPETAIREDRLDNQGQLPGFGQLHPRTQGITTLGTIYSSSLFPNRIPAGEVLLLSYFGGALNRAVATMKEEDIIAQVDKDLRKMLLKNDAPAPKKVAVRVWPRAIPQFNVGHLEAVETAQGELKKAGWDGVLLGGNYVSGVALGKCVEYGYEYAGKIAQAMKVKKGA